MVFTSQQASSSGTLRRGKACLNCRHRKMKCDGTRPVCGPCSRANRPDDCEYTDGQGRTRTQMLEETIAQLESRIQELENPSSTSGSAMHHDPQSSFFQAQQSPLLGPSLPVLLSQADFLHGSQSSASLSPCRDATGLTTQSSASTAWLLSEEPPTMQYPRHIDAPNHNATHYLPYPQPFYPQVPQVPYVHMYRDDGVAELVPAQAHPVATEVQENYNVHFPAVDPPKAFPNVQPYPAPLADVPAAANGLRDLVSRFLNNPGTLINILRIEPGPGGRFEAWVAFELANIF